MLTLRLAGYLLIASFAFLVVGAAVAPPSAYSGPDIPSRLAAISENSARWKLSKVFDGMAIVTPAIAILVLTVALKEKQPSLPLLFGTLGFVVSGLVGLLVVYRLAFDPQAAFTISLPAVVDIPGSLGLTLGMLFVGWAYLQGAFPAWIGYLSIAAGLLSLAAYFFIGFSLAFYVVGVLYIVNTVIGVVIVRTAG